MSNADEKDRRASIVEGLAAANDMVEAAVAGGLYQQNMDMRGTSTAFHHALKKYNEHCVAILSKFAPGEESVAFWTQVEMYSAFVEPAVRLLSGEPLKSDAGESEYTVARVDLLRDWPRGGASPQYADQPNSEHDKFRHGLVPPQTETPPDMVWAPILRNW